MSLFMLFFIPFGLPLIILFVAFLLVVFEAKMVSEIVHNNEMRRAEKVFWVALMIPFLPLTAAAYYFAKVYHHNTTHLTT